MATEILDTKEIFQQLEKAVSELLSLISALEEKEINTVPYEDSWTAGQLFRHVTKSTNGIARALTMQGKPANRNTGERIPELRKTFLDFSTKMKSPEFIVPEPGPYEKQVTIAKLNQSFERLKESANNAVLNEIVGGLPIGEVTKLEMIHFVLYHTQRHLHQMKKIFESLKSSQV